MRGADMTYAELRALDEKEWREQDEAERNRRRIKRVLDIEKVKACFAERNQHGKTI